MLYRSIWNVGTVKKCNFLHRMTMRVWGLTIEPITNRLLRSVCAGLLKMKMHLLYNHKTKCIQLKTLFFIVVTLYAILSFAVRQIALREKGDSILVRPAGTRSSLSFPLSCALCPSHCISGSSPSLCTYKYYTHIPDSAKPVKVIDLAD